MLEELLCICSPCPLSLSLATTHLSEVHMFRFLHRHRTGETTATNSANDVDTASPAEPHNGTLDPLLRLVSLPPSYRELDPEIDRSFDSGGDMFTTAAGIVYELTAVQNRIPNPRYLFWLRRRTDKAGTFTLIHWLVCLCLCLWFSFPKLFLDSLRKLERWLHSLMTRGKEKIPIRFLICLCCVRLPFSGLDRNQMRLAKITNTGLCLGPKP